MIKAAKGEKFVLQVGDCAETFKECNEEDWMTKIEFFNVLKKFSSIILTDAIQNIQLDILKAGGPHRENMWVIWQAQIGIL